MQAKSANPRLHEHNCWLGIPRVAWVILFAIVANLPFINQAYHMDDGIYLMIARNVQQSPWFPQDFPLFFEGLYGPDLASTEHAWPLTSYFAALLAVAGGFKEVWLHLGFLVFPALISWGMYSLASDLTRYPMLATVSLLTLPVVAVSSHTLMTDIPLLALWLTAVVLFRRGLISGSAPLLWTGSIVAAVTCTVTYAGLCVVVLLTIYALLRRKPTAALIMIVVPTSALSALFAVNYTHYQRFTPTLLIHSYLSAKHVLSLQLMSEKVLFFILALGSVTVSPIFAVRSNGLKITLGLLAAAIGFALMLPQCSDYSAAQKALFIVFCWTGLCLLIRVAGQLLRGCRGLRTRSLLSIEDVFLGLWVLAVFLFCILTYMTGSARHLLPAMPPMMLILFRLFEQIPSRLTRRLLFVVNLTFCTIVASILSFADFEMAAVYRNFADTISRSSSLQRRNLWLTGEWGFRAYLEQIGARELGRRDGRAKPGDILIVPTLATPYSTLYSDKLNLPSIVLVAPSSIRFQIPPLPPGSSMVSTIGMPFHAMSDGMQCTVRFESGDANRVLLDKRIDPSSGRRWKILNLPLPETARQGGTILLEAGVGTSGDANADWLAFGRARIAIRDEDGEKTIYDFREHLNQAQIKPVAGLQYHTNDNVPVLLMDVWLEQAPAVILRGTYEYRVRSPVRLLDNRSRAGFWSSSWGLLPYSIAQSNAVLETISVYEVTREVDDYGERPVSWYEK